jgi:hypothetical protein
MNEQELRSLVREAVDRHLGRPQSQTSAVAFGSGPSGDVRRAGLLGPAHPHPSHVLLNVVAGSDADDGMCVIEPAVHCNHCGYCRSFGH